MGQGASLILAVLHLRSKTILGDRDDDVGAIAAAEARNVAHRDLQRDALSYL